MKAWRFLACAVVVLSSTAFAAPDDAPPKVELPLGPYVRPGRPLDVRVIGGADRVRAPGTPWALPQGAHGDEFILQMPAAVEAAIDVTIERGSDLRIVRCQASVLPADGKIVALVGGTAAPEGVVGIPVGPEGLPTVDSAWALFDDVVGDLGALAPKFRDHVAPRTAWRCFDDPISAGPDPGAFAATAETAARTPLVSRGVEIVFLLFSATELVLAAFQRSRRDRPWVRAAWLSAPAVAMGLFLAATNSIGAALRATPVAFESEEYVGIVYVRIDALRDGVGSLELPSEAPGTAAGVRFGPDDSTVTEMSLGRTVRVALRQGEARVIAYKRGFGGRLSFFAPTPMTPGPAVVHWLSGLGVVSDAARAGVDKAPVGRGIDVLPGLELHVDRAAPDK